MKAQETRVKIAEEIANKVHEMQMEGLKQLSLCHKDRAGHDPGLSGVSIPCISLTNPVTRRVVVFYLCFLCELSWFALRVTVPPQFHVVPVYRELISNSVRNQLS